MLVIFKMAAVWAQSYQNEIFNANPPPKKKSLTKKPTENNRKSVVKWSQIHQRIDL
jgi:hypothetical protein